MLASSEKLVLRTDVSSSLVLVGATRGPKTAVARLPPDSLFSLYLRETSLSFFTTPMTATAGTRPVPGEGRDLSLHQKVQMLLSHLHNTLHPHSRHT